MSNYFKNANTCFYMHVENMSCPVSKAIFQVKMKPCPNSLRCLLLISSLKWGMEAVKLQKQYS